MNIKQLKLNEIRPYDRNPRKNDRAVDTVAQSIEQYGFQQPIVVDNDGVIIVGHTRYRAAQKLNLLTVPVLIADNLTQDQVQAYRIMDNRSNENSRWDDQLLLEELRDLLESIDIPELSNNTGFTESELHKMFRDETTEELLAKYQTSAPRSQSGDMWNLGNHRLLNGDSTVATDLELLLANDTIDLIWEDPPYGISYETANGINYSAEENALRNHKIANDSLTPEQLDQFLNQHLTILMPHIRPGCPIYWCHDIRYSHQFQQLLLQHGIHIADILIWRKNNSSNWLSNYAKYYEPIIYGWRSGSEHPWYGRGMQPNAQADTDWDSMTREQLLEIVQSQPRNYQEVAREPRRIASLHPTVKPVKLITQHIYNSTRPNEIVYDGFAGSGSTLIAAELTGRYARCIEFEPKFCDVIIQRWQDLTGLKATRSDGVLWDDIRPLDNLDQSVSDLVNENLSKLLNLPETQDE